ncbi:uncharacterized protein LOC122801032 [Protopterus annectens]|uniref:uncharacterized protein LOC122801032 n=1 Tax=Protopterus annectens TaxID=7888 RepID=UPI001CF9B40D|nr:uncharacterized protein LOC122801032 [Protopterus annectens]
MKADKGSGTMVMEQKKYIQTFERSLTDDQVYKNISIKQAQQHFKQIDDLILELYLRDEITQAEKDFMLVTKPSLGKFFGIPKVHMNPDDPPFRHVVSNQRTKTKKISQYVDHILSPIVQSSKYYTKDFWAFLNNISKLKLDGEEYLLVTLDVEDLYRNIPHTRGLTLTRQYLTRHSNLSVTKINTVCRITEAVLKNNFFQFNGKIYHQQKGAAMGSKMAPAYANLVFSAWEMDKVERLPCFNNTIMYRRYIDDVFFVWKGDRPSLNSFLESLFHSLDFLTLTIGHVGMPTQFLDIHLTVDPQSGYFNSNIYTASPPLEVIIWSMAVNIHNS